jgi:hypothetical protein
MPEHSKSCEFTSGGMADAQTQNVWLTTKGLTHMPPNCYENDFAFIVGELEYRCPCFLADFLSPRVARLRLNDPTIREFVIDVRDPNRDFSSLFAVLNGSPLVLKTSALDFFFAIARKLSNGELFNSLCALRGDCPQNIVEDLRFLVDAGDAFDCEPLLEKCSSSFFELPESSLRDLDVSLLVSILSHPLLRVASEDNLSQFVKNQIEREESYSVLLEFVRFEYLSLASIHDFTTLISSSFSILAPAIWGSLVPRLNLSVLPSPLISGRWQPPTILYEGRPLDGIISFLSREFGGSVHDQGVVEVLASGQHWPECGVSVVADFKSDLKGFATANSKNSWICFDFKTAFIRPTHYSIRTRTDDDCHQPRSWVLEGSNDNKEWIILDTRQDNQELTGTGCVKTFSVENVATVRWLRIRQTGPNKNGNHYLILKSLEFFGWVAFGVNNP